MADQFTPYDKTTINEFIGTYDTLAVTEGTICYKELINDEIAIKYHNVISKYIDILKPFIENTTLSEDEMIKYKYKPNLFCYEIYGTPELTYSLLYINNMVSMADFTKNQIKVFRGNILEVLRELTVLNKEDLDNNRAETGLK